MSSYTTQIRWWCETLAGLPEGSPINQVLTIATPKVFNFDFPMYDESYRNVLETKILKHYYFREIGLETVGLFRAFLDRKLNEIMPYYNQLYKSTLLDFNPFYDVDLSRSHNRKEDGNTTTNQTANTDFIGNVTTNDNNSTIGKSESNSSSDTNTTSNETVGDKTVVDGNSSDKRTSTDANLDAYSETPQSSVTNLENYTYLTNARKVTDNATQDGTTTNHSETDVTGTNDVTGQSHTVGNDNTNTSSDFKGTVVSDTDNTTKNTSNLNTDVTNLEEYTEIVKGKQGTQSYSSMLEEFRGTMLNIDMLIIEELEPLFMQVWD